MSFLGIVPGQGSRYALERSLRARADDDRFAKYMLDHGTWFQGRKLPDKYESLRGPMRLCHGNSLTLALAYPDAFHYWTGIYSVAPHSDTLRWTTHSWLTDNDGGLVEVTFPTDERLCAGGFLSDGGGASAIPWMPPEHWAYVGCEFDPDFIRCFDERWGLPVFDPLPRYMEGFERLMAVPYAKRPFDPSA